LKLALQKIVEVQQVSQLSQVSQANSPLGTPVKKGTSITTSDKKIGMSASSKDGEPSIQPVSFEEDLEIMGNINKISTLLNESNIRVEELVAVNESLSLKMQ